MIANLTGHDIHIVNKFGEVVKTIETCPYEEPIRAEVKQRRLNRIEGIKVTKLYYNTDVSLVKMRELTQKYSCIIVSKITAEALKAQGFTDNIYISGRKFYLYGELVGVKELSKF